MSTYDLIRDPVRYRRAAQMAIRVAHGVPVVWDKRTGRMFRLNDTALEILGAIAQEDRTLTDLVDIVGRKHREKAGVVHHDVEKFVIGLVEKGIVIEV